MVARDGSPPMYVSLLEYNAGKLVVETMSLVPSM